MLNRLARIALPVIACTLLSASLASAQATRTWVSGVGDDVNPCSRTAPCKTFAGAISKTAAGGEISVLDGGGFGGVTITKSITLNGDSQQTGILVAGQNGITINGSGAPIVVQLRHLQLNGVGLTTSPSGIAGIRLISGATLIVDDVFISGFQTGIQVEAGNALVDHSLISTNSAFGVNALGGSLTVTNSTLVNNGVAVQATGAGIVRLSNNDIFSNLTGFGCGGGTLASAGNNRKGNNSGGVVAACAPTLTLAVQ